MRGVFDTNIFISAFVVPGSKAEDAYLHCIRGEFTLCTSVAILSELAQKLREKFGWQEDKIIRLLKTVAGVATVVKTRPHLHLLADEPDNRILECAAAAEADMIITGDKHLLSLGHFRAISVVTLARFLESLRNGKG